MNNNRISRNIEISSEVTAMLLNISEQAIRAKCSKSRYSGAHKNDLGTWCIPLSSLPPLAQARYWINNLNHAPSGWKDKELRELPEEEAKALWSFFEECSEKLKQKAYRDTEACQVMANHGITRCEF